MGMMLLSDEVLFRFFFVSIISSHNGEAPPTSSLSLQMKPTKRCCPTLLQCCCFPCHLHLLHGPHCCHHRSPSSFCRFPIHLHRRTPMLMSLPMNPRRPFGSLAAVSLHVAAADLILSLVVRLPEGSEYSITE